MASFSRLQLAAALLEYDNDPENPNAPRKSAYDSAIFARLRSANASIHVAKAREAARSSNYLGVALPSEPNVPSEHDKGLSRRSKASIDMLHNPFGGDEEEEAEEDLEVDLASWGLDSLIPEKNVNKSSKNAKGKAKSEVLPNTRRASTIGIGPRPVGERMAHFRTRSMPLAEFGEEALLDAKSDGRRNTISSPLDFAELGGVERRRERQRGSSHALIENLPVRPPLHSLSSFRENRDIIPFPSESPPPAHNEANNSSSSRPASRLDALSEGRGSARGEELNPFAIPPPPPSRASRFDPKSVAHVRTLSNATRLSTRPQLAYNDENENYLSPRAPSRGSVLEVKSACNRRLSVASFGTRDMLDDDYQSAYGGEEYPSRERRYSRLDLMRPKVLVMPSPLQSASAAVPSVSKPARKGFMDSTDGRPLPPGARTSRMSVLGISPSTNVLVASNSFTPNPRLNLSSSQLLFRNNLMIDGQRDVTYNDIDGTLRRAVEEGEQVQLEFPVEVPKPVLSAPSPAEEVLPVSRPPGKLFGRSLIDNLEARKAEMRGKKRVFTGDQRPSMMDREGMKRSSTLIDPASLPHRPPTGNRVESSQSDTGLTRRGSRSGKPLLAIDDAGQIAETGVRESRVPQTRSVFGVDTLWEREMAKLKMFEAQEKVEAEERKKQEDEDELKREKRRKDKGKRREPKDELYGSVEPSPSPISPDVSVSLQPEPSPSLSLPDIPTVTSRKRVVPIPFEDDSDYESSASEAAPGPKPGFTPLDEAADQWVSDDEKTPARASEIGLGYLASHLALEEDSDEDLPLSITLQRATQKLVVSRVQPDDDSDEDKPLSSLLDKPKLNLPPIDFDKLDSPGSDLSPKDDDDDDDDNVPLGIRASRLPGGASHLAGLSTLPVGGNEDEDDRPLSMHPGQIRKSQFQMFAQVQQQQIFQAQMANSMPFAPPPSMMIMMPQPTPFVPHPPIQMQEPNKFNSVDRWRHGVAVEGQL